ncbi:cupin domain-containing protein [Oceanobacillus neutriphilus]|uniref:Cupin type-2 domain-containing protein n=1 Tax=Oceanobacillus neutriphilus TaxID=531815 RepID=A0ABQ2P1J1_9BACI|nr:cupin domain-containing protein [Oceanobacillus neutriphilus]GGP15826.1 hypothetical protein GCM10011346_45310 [Oceanobacillus neutriphilus]
MPKEKVKTQYVGKIKDLPVVDISNFILGGEKRIVFGPDRFWDSHVMRHLTLKPGAVVPLHDHPWLHWALCVGGEGKFVVGKDEYDIENGSWMHVPSSAPHQFWNTSKTDALEIICIVIPKGDVNPVGDARGC